MLWCQAGQNIGVCNCKRKSALKYDHNARPSQTDGNTDKHYQNSTMIRSNERAAC